MFIFISSHTKSLHFRGHHLLECPNCEQVQPHGHYAISQSDAIYFIEISSGEVGTLSVCEVCGHALAFPPRHAVALTRKWRMADGVEALAEATGWPGARPLPQPVNPKTIAALVRRIAKSKPHFQLEIFPEAAFTAAAGGIVGGALLGFLGSRGVRIFPGLDPVGHGMTGVIGGLLVGIVGGAVWKALRARRRLYLNEVLAFQRKLGLTSEQLKRVVADDRGKRGVVHDVIQSLR